MQCGKARICRLLHWKIIFSKTSLTENDYFLQNVGCAHCSVGFKNDDLSRPDPISRSKLFLWTEISEREKERKKLVRPTSHHRLHVVPTKERYWQSEITVFSLLSKWSRCFLTIFFSFFYVQLLHENWIVS